MSNREQSVNNVYYLKTIIQMSSIRDFIPLSKLGEGTFSTVYKVRRISDQKVYALKKVRMNNLTQKQKQNALNEIRILASLECPHIVGYKEAFFDEKLLIIGIVMEFADGGDLHRFISDKKKRFLFIEEREIWKFISNILMGLKHLHGKGILHRDLKSANIFIHGDQYKLGDLNVSKVNGGRLAYTQTGTPYYASPEVWRDEPYDSKSDIWSFGCIVYEMACLKPPFNGRDMDQLYQSVQHKKYQPIPQRYSVQLSELISLCLQKNPRNRPNADQLLKHPLIQTASLNNHLRVEGSETNKELLQTIKLPTDMRSLHMNLPESKYQKKERPSSFNIESPKNFMSDRRYPNINNLSFVKSPKKQVNRSQIFTSPKNIKRELSPQIYMSPSEVITKKATSAHVNLSQKRIFQNSERIDYSQPRKSCSAHKVAPFNKYQQYIKQQVSKQAMVMPRTQKRKIISQNGPDKRAIEEWKKKLVKKSRIFSNNNLKQFLIN